MSGAAAALVVPEGYRVGRWEVREPIAAGDFASVYAGRAGDGSGAEGPLATAALKFVPTGPGSPRHLRHLRELAEREVSLLRRLRGPRLIRLLDALTVTDTRRPELDGATVLALERAETSLAALLERAARGGRARALPGAGPVLAQLCEGLAQLHGAGWVHGDVKPGNVLVMRDGSVRIADFSTAAELEGAYGYAPLFASPDYAPPELLSGTVTERGLRTSAATDVWAFGIVAHQVLTGGHPFPGCGAAARREAVLRYAGGAAELCLSPALPARWRPVVADCLSRDPGERAVHGVAALLPRVMAAARDGTGAPADAAARSPAER